MSAHRVIPDSDDEEGHFSDGATSIDPLSETPQKGLRDMAAAHATTDKQMPWQGSMSDSGLPQVDFDQFLQSEPSFTTSPQQRRWMPEEDSNESGAAVPFDNNEGERREDAGFIYTVNSPYAGVNDLLDTTVLPTVNDDDNVVSLNGFDTEDARTQSQRPQKHQRVSPNTDVRQGSMTKTDHSQDANAPYIYSESFRPNDISQTTTIPLESSGFNQPEVYGSDGRARSKSLLPHYESPPPTEPFSSTFSPMQKRSKTDLADVQSTFQPPLEAHREPIVQGDGGLRTLKKKRGRPKKQAAALEDDEDDAKDELNDVSEPDVQTAKRGPGRPKKQEANDVNDENQAEEHEISTGADVLDHAREQESSTKPGKASRKKKMRRSKTTSAVPRKSTELDVERDVIWIDNDPVNGDLEQDIVQEPITKSATNEEQDIASKSASEVVSTEKNAPEPPKRGRKRKQTNPEPPLESPAVLQDISNISHPPPTTNAAETDGIKVVIEQHHQHHASEPPPGPSAPQNQTPTDNDEDNTATTSDGRGPDRHSPIAKTSKVPYRVGLSRRARIAPLLKVVRK